MSGRDVAGIVADVLEAAGVSSPGGANSAQAIAGYLAEARDLAAADELARMAERAAAGHGPDAGELRALAARRDAAAGAPSIGAGPRLQRVDVARMVTTPPPPVPWVVEGLAARGCLTLLAGREGLGKSLLAMAMAVGVLTGDDAGPFATRQGRVMIVDGENGESELHRRVRGLGIDPEAAKGLAVYLTEAPDLLNDLAELEAEIARERPDLVVIDALRTLWAGKENASEEIGPAIDGLRNLARRADVAMLLLHHAGKLGAEYRGSTAIGAGCQVIVGLGREPEDPEPHRFFLLNAKMRPAPRWPKRWIRLVAERGAILLEGCEPPEDQADSPGRPASAREELGPRLLALVVEEPQIKADLARALGRTPRDGSVARMLGSLVEEGAIVRLPDGRYARSQNPASPRGSQGFGSLPKDPENPYADGDSQGSQGGSQNGGVAPTLAPLDRAPTAPRRDLPPGRRYDPDDPAGRPTLELAPAAGEEPA